MKKWHVEVPVGTSVLVTVEAETAESAIEAVESLPSLCAQCSGWGQGFSREEWEPDWDRATADEADA